MLLRFYRRQPIMGLPTYDPSQGGQYEEFDFPAVTTAPAVLTFEVGQYIIIGTVQRRVPSGSRTFNRLSQVPGVSAVYVEQ